ncbi:uncharacterized protein ARMOST_14554 [Armillaria ostoyae]|uniref:Uncharacterized protein n=1 Tax=Armillaria ostoyae TaxID=47428 RepID=A0A284RQW6_ARMOS|nr:uncharacterized protein ARMOST_14554 [Armillaria ostoyae]
MAGSGMPFLQARPRPRISKDGRSCRPAIDIIALPRGHEGNSVSATFNVTDHGPRGSRTACRFASRILTAFDDGEEFLYFDDNKPAVRFGIGAIVCQHEGARSFVVNKAVMSLLMRVWAPQYMDDSYTVDTKGTAAIPATSPSDLRNWGNIMFHGGIPIINLINNPVDIISTQVNFHRMSRYFLDITYANMPKRSFQSRYWPAPWCWAAAAGAGRETKTSDNGHDQSTYAIDEELDGQADLIPNACSFRK